MKRSLFVTALLIASLTSPAQAQLDHLQCYKVKDRDVNARVEASLNGPQFGLSENCRIRVKARQFCAPVEKTVTQTDPDLFPKVVPAQELRDDRICYKVKCPRPDPPIPSQEVVDQFGQRVLTKFKTSTICTPAVKPGSSPCGDNLVDPGEDCDGTDDDACPGECRQDCTCSESACRLPATGEVTAYGAASDGAVQAGAALSYTDNGDGTITDNNTGLMWEKKDDSGGDHDKDTVYTWSTGAPWDMDGTITTTFLAVLNTGGGFAGHTDWRIPNVKELHSIIDFESFNPAVDPAFHKSATCDTCADVTLATCSCTKVARYWSSTTSIANGPVTGPTFAWGVFFTSGGVGDFLKDPGALALYARAVRGGL